MAPNVKQLHLLAHSIADLEIVTSKYAPLTQETTQEVVATPAVVASSSIESVSYWDWPADVPAVEEPKKDLFSASFLEANLIKECQQESSNVAVVNADENDCQSSHDYWTWPAATTTGPQEEETRRIASDNYWAWKTPAEETATTDSEEEQALKEAYSKAYWEWRSDDVNQAAVVEDNDAVVRSILQNENIRAVFSVERLVEHLKANQLPESVGLSSCRDSNDYWDWNAKSTPVVAAADQGYWDW